MQRLVVYFSRDVKMNKEDQKIVWGGFAVGAQGMTLKIGQ